MNLAFRQRPIRQKLILISLAGSGLALLLASFGFAAYEVFTARAEMVTRIATLATVVAGNSTAALSFGNVEDARTNLNMLGAEPQVRAACFFDDHNDLFAGYVRANANAKCPAHNSLGTAPVFSGKLIRYSHSIIVAGDKVGSLLVVAEAVALHQRLQRYLLIALLVMSVSVAAAVWIAARLQRLISAPILQLVAMSRRVSAEKDYSLRAEHSADDELGLLIDAFNDMLTQVQHRDARLERQRDRLDDEVKTRTHELESAVGNLQVEILQRRKAEARIRHLAYYDVLTGLPNRQLLRERLQRAISEAEEQPEQIMALLFLDLNHFKKVNDVYGHSAGDELLEQVAGRLRRCLRPHDGLTQGREPGQKPTVSRQGGDEFTVLLESLSAPLDAGLVAARISESLREAFVLSKATVHVGTSIGIAVYPQDGRDAETLFKHANTAMYHAKRTSGDEFEFFSEAMKIAALEKLDLEADLRRALDEQQFVVYFQPLVDLQSGGIVQLEALIRWQHPQRGLIAPDAFIPVAENCGLINAIGEWVLTQACHCARTWESAIAPPPRVAVNVSSRQFQKGQIQRSVVAALAASGLPASRLELEITESSVLENETTAGQVLVELKAQGISVALDDFGTGYSSLSHLQHVPLDTLKIDRSFIEDIESEGDARSIVITLITMAHHLSLRVVAEGIETDTQRRLLCAWGCDIGQGFLFSKPLAADAVANLLKQGTAYPMN